jgi:hypothetical protein
MKGRIAALLFIFLCTTIAWAILGSTIFSRTYTARPELKGKVESTWGAPQEQAPPSAGYSRPEPRKIVSAKAGKSVEEVRIENVWIPLPLDSSRLDVDLDLDYRQKGLLWYSTYRSRFSGVYGFRNNTDREQTVTFRWSFPVAKAIYDDLSLTLNGQPFSVADDNNALTGSAPLAAGAVASLKVTYRSPGLDSWRYNFGSEVSQVRDFSLNMTTNFGDIDFPENSLSPSDKQASQAGWRLTWKYTNLVTGYNIAMTMPSRVQPGPLAGEISYFAPVALFFFFFVLFLVTTLRGIELHPMNYFFLAAAFFAFHLLLAYLVDHISIHIAFAICSIVSIALVVSYLRLVVGMRFALREAGAAQFVFLVLFSYAFFFRGFTGLAITLGAILTLFVAMQATGRIDWSRQFRAARETA